MKTIVAVLVLALAAQAQQVQRWSATTGDVALVAAGTKATLQQPAVSAGSAAQVTLDIIQVYCSVDCTVTQAVNGTAASTTAGTIIPLLPTQLNLTAPLNFFTASNVGSGTGQGGAIHVPAGSTIVICMSRACGAAADVQLGTGGGTATNYTAVVSSITGTANITFFLRTVS